VRLALDDVFFASDGVERSFNTSRFQFEYEEIAMRGDLMFFNKCISAGCLSVAFFLTFFQGPASSKPEESFVSRDGTFAFKYPNSFVRCERNPKQPDRWIPEPSCQTYTPVCIDAAFTEDATVVCIAYPAENLSGTNFQSAAFSVSQLDTLTADECQQVTEPHPATPHKEKVNGLTFEVFDVGGAAAGNLLAADAYRSFHQNRCYELDLRIGFSSIGNFEPGTVKEFDHEAVRRSLKSVLDTFTFLK
jgi:hypothetical protein